MRVKDQMISKNEAILLVKNLIFGFKDSTLRFEFKAWKNVVAIMWHHVTSNLDGSNLIDYPPSLRN